MSIEKVKIHNSVFIGVFMTATDKFVIIPKATAKKTKKKIIGKGELETMALLPQTI